MSNYVGHAVLCAASIYAIHENPNLSWISITFELLLAFGVLSIIDNYVKSPELRNGLKYARNITELLPLAFVNTQFLLPVQPTLAYLHSISIIAPLSTNIIEYDQLDAERITNIVLLGNVGTAIYLTIELRNLWFLVLAAIALVNRFAVDKAAEKLKINNTQALSVGLGLFCIILTICLRYF